MVGPATAPVTAPELPPERSSQEEEEEEEPDPLAVERTVQRQNASEQFSLGVFESGLETGVWVEEVRWSVFWRRRP